MINNTKVTSSPPIAEGLSEESGEPRPESMLLNYECFQRN